ncbi:hypothetical protein M3Y97_00946700 [Aphelenchoides bicaudatus]|nr:hypothetical protein M3Y97_00946700 [Aphelenchoides bicaudatus]
MKLLHNQTNEIRIYYRTWFPFLNRNCTRVPTFHPNAYCLYPGMMIEMLNLITKKAGLKIVNVRSKKDDNDHLGYNTINQLIDNVYDIEATTWQITDERLKLFDFTESLYLVKTALIHKQKTEKLADIFGFFHSYDIKIWLIIFAVGFIQWMCCVLSQKLNLAELKRPKQNFIDAAWQVLRLQLLQPCNRIQHQMNAGYRSVNEHIFFLSILQVRLTQIGCLKTSTIPNLTRTIKYDTPSKSIHFTLLAMFERLCNWPSTTETPCSFNKQTILGYYLMREYCELASLEQGMPVVGAHLMLIKGHPLLKRLNEAIKSSESQIHIIQKKYEKLVLQI